MYHRTPVPVIKAWIVLLLCVVLVSGCEDDSSSGSTYRHEKVGTIRTHTAVNGDGVYDCAEGFRLVVPAGTEVWHTRGSCSGFTASSATALRAGDTAIFRFSYDDVVWGPRTVYYAQSVEAYAPECLGLIPVPPTNAVPPCDPCVWFN
jgi:hypothetical protein